MLLFAAHNGGYKSVQLLLAAGCDVNDRDSTGDTPLIKVAKEERFICLKVLLKANADVNATNNLHTSALMCTAVNGLKNASLCYISQEPM